MVNIGKKLKTLRSERDLSLDMLVADMNYKYPDININKSMLSRWENGINDPSLEYAKNIANYYKAGHGKYTKAIVLVETSVDCPLSISEFKPLQASLGRITGHCNHTVLLFGKKPDLGYDLHLLIILSR